VFEHKFAEAMLLVMALGATRMAVRWEKDGSRWQIDQLKPRGRA